MAEAEAEDARGIARRGASFAREREGRRSLQKKQAAEALWRCAASEDSEIAKEVVREIVRAGAVRPLVQLLACADPTAAAHAAGALATLAAHADELVSTQSTAVPTS